MNDHVIEVIKEYFSLIEVEIDKLPIKIEFDDSSRIDMEVSGDSLLVVFTPIKKEDDFKQVIHSYLVACYFSNQTNNIIKLGVHSEDHSCFICAIDFSEVTLPSLTEIIDSLVNLRDNIS